MRWMARHSRDLKRKLRELREENPKRCARGGCPIWIYKKKEDMKNFGEWLLLCELYVAKEELVQPI